MSLADHVTRRSDDNAAVKTGVASGLSLRDRRDTYRVHIPGIKLQPVISFQSETGLVKGQLQDISRTGASALVDENFVVAVGSSFPCQISLPDGQFATTVEVRSIKALKSRVRVGLLFSKLSILQHVQIDTTVATLERSLLRGSIYLRK